MNDRWSLLFHDVGERPVITWAEKSGHYTTLANYLLQYERWKNAGGGRNPNGDGELFGSGKHRPDQAFFEAKGEYIARAARTMGAVAALITRDDGRRVTWNIVYNAQTFRHVKDAPSYLIRHASAELSSGMVNVKLYLPDDEEAAFRFKIRDEDVYAGILKPKPKPADPGVCSFCLKSDCSGGCTQ